MLARLVGSAAVRRIAILMIATTIAGCGGTRPELAPGAAEQTPPPQADVLLWMPLAAGDLVRVHLRDGSQRVRRLRAGDDSYVVLEHAPRNDVFAHDSAPDTVSRASIEYLEQFGRPKFTGPSYSGALGAVMGLGLGIAAVVALQSIGD